jgi:hypothetical protein
VQRIFLAIICCKKNISKAPLCGEIVSIPLNIPRVGTRPYEKFINELRLAVLAPTEPEAIPLLDGLAAKRCLDLVRPKSIRRLGAFFTPSRIAQRILEAFSINSWANAKVFDPTCGAGDLLLPFARQLPLKRTVSVTLKFWNNRISGCDISPEFIEAARLRIILLAVTRGSRLDDSSVNLAPLLSNVFVADGLSVSDPYSKSSYIVMNPPYGRVDSGNQTWREGAVTAAALFVERAARLSSPGTQIAALLPEVLRTGSSYENWRSHIRGFVTQGTTNSIGLFSDHADVDVFVQRYIKQDHHVKMNKRVSDIATQPTNLHQTLGDNFVVTVGAVVPYRDLRTGRRLAYLHPKNAPAWGEIRRVNETRKFKGRTFIPPFVVVRRTSRPGDRHRATASLVLGKRKVAVENHLIVIIPKHGGNKICQAAMRLLRLPTTDAFLDRVMRCRHLTTGSVSSIPWP